MYINILPYFTPTRTGGCPKNCSGQGDCSGDICTCHPGYRGKDCSGIICPNNCSQNGNCVNDQCQCFQDFKGQYYSQSGHLTNKINHDWFVKVTLSLSVCLSFSLSLSSHVILQWLWFQVRTAVWHQTKLPGDRDFYIATSWPGCHQGQLLSGRMPSWLGDTPSNH